MADQLMDLPHTTGASFAKTCFNGFNALSGIGLLTTPYALSKSGWLSLGLLLVMAITTCYTGILLTKCLNTNRSMKTYSDVAFRAFGRKGRIFVSIFLYLEVYLVPTGLLIMEADNLVKLFPHLGVKGVNFGGLHVAGKPFFTMLVGLIILPSMWLKDLRLLSYISLCGILSTIVIISAIVWVGIDEVGFSAAGEIFDWKGLPTALSLYAFCYGAHPVFPVLYSSMKQKNHFFKVLLITFFLCTVNYMLVAILGYLMFGKNVQSQLTLNMSTKLGSKIVIYTSLAAPMVKYALIISPIADAIEMNLPSKWKSKLVWILVRTLLLVSTVVVALVFPYFESLTGLVGAILCVTISILLPCICYLKIFSLYQKFDVEVLIVGSIMVMAVAVGVMGTYASVKTRE
ncbi:putative amino acid transporter, transmembrane domain-containing protein [Rosa chinensis]|uniref:Putative amino acid transporter, transmembrane domain-containing protein n=1 Tax=Rosa chinensis TaxID=74649 RepID=A0A2P6P2U8_ROSCH|nr:amino acid transporter AVT1I [Rosa chinensis]XP_040367485.1 amino acid transporter AVT1I [Rosa chinensis]XP_040367486.1 amino acid transporter AVT1I [Rosa chinensis]PRQ16254.1 putative amino acid transporter, transmembrane domain-containing protein [Rosa chinensis]